MNNQFYGWYDDPAQPAREPSYDPPHDTACPFCGIGIAPDDVRTHSLMYAGPIYAKRSYFYRTHRTCSEKGAGGAGMDGFILDMIARNGG